MIKERSKTYLSKANFICEECEEKVVHVSYVNKKMICTACKNKYLDNLKPLQADIDYNKALFAQYGIKK